MNRKRGPFTIQGYDSFEGEFYNIHPAAEHVHTTYEEAAGDAHEQWSKIQQEQPIEDAGEIQDRVYIVDLDGTKYPYYGDQ